VILCYYTIIWRKNKDSDELSKRAEEFLGALSLSGSTFSISGSLTDRREFWTRRKTASF